MPRPQPRTGASTWTAVGHRLTPEERRHTAKLLGYEVSGRGLPVPAIAALRKVEKWLGFYKGAVVAMSTSPRGATVIGRPKNDALRKAILELRRIFATYYVGGGATHRPKKRGALLLSITQQRECEFIDYALDVANIPCPGDIRRRLLEPDVALPSERSQVMERLARAARKRTR